MYFYGAMRKLERLRYGQKIRYERSIGKKSTRVLRCALKTNADID